MALIPQVVVVKVHPVPGRKGDLELCATIYYDTEKGDSDDAYVVLEGRSRVSTPISIRWEDFEREDSLDDTQIPIDVKTKVAELLTQLENAAKEYVPPQQLQGEEKNRVMRALKRRLDHRH